MRMIAGLAALALAGCGFGLESQAREALSSELKDPESAQFKDLRKTPGGGICGQVNSKNSFGAYTGFTYFYSLGGVTMIDDEKEGTRYARGMCNE